MGRIVEIPVDRCTRMDMPEVCVLTGSTEEIAWFPYVVRAFKDGRLREHVIELPMNEAARDRWLRLWRPAWRVVAVVTFVIVAAAAVLLVDVSGSTFHAALVALGLGLGTTISFVRNRSPRCVNLTSTAVVLYLPSEAAAVAIAEAVASPRSEASLVEGACCALHGTPATHVCARCGGFSCGECGPVPFCPPCGRRLDEEKEKVLDDVEARRRRALVILGVIALTPPFFPLKVLSLLDARALARTGRLPRTSTVCRLVMVVSALGIVVDLVLIAGFLLSL